MPPQTDLITEDARGLLDHAAEIAHVEPFDVAGSDDSEFTEPESHAVDYLGEHDLDVHYTSSSRIMFTLPDEYAPFTDLMVKVARYREDGPTGTRVNRTEYDIWTDAPDAVRNVLNPVIAIGEADGWVAMPVATPIDNPDMESVQERAMESGFDMSDIDESHLGHVDDAENPLIIDYGHV